MEFHVCMTGRGAEKEQNVISYYHKTRGACKEHRAGSMTQPLSLDEAEGYTPYLVFPLGL